MYYRDELSQLENEELENDVYNFPTSGDTVLTAGGQTDGIDHDTIIGLEVKTPAKWNGTDFEIFGEVQNDTFEVEKIFSLKTKDLHKHLSLIHI
mgnify:CR=1 FL=1